MRAYRRRILSKWDRGLNSVEKPTPPNAYQVGKNMRLTEFSRPERRAGTAKKGTVGINKPILGATKYYPTGDTALFVAVVDDSGGSNSDVYYGSSIGSLSAASLTMTAGATPYFATFPVTEGSGLVDSLFIVNGNEEIYYDPTGGTWSTLAASGVGTLSVTGLVHICVHGDRLWMFKNNYGYYSNLAGTAAGTLLSNNNFLDLAYEGDGIQAGVSLGDVLVIFRRNSIGVFRGKDPLSGIQVTAQVKGSGCPAPKTLVVAPWRGQKAVYYLSLQGWSVFDGYNSRLIDARVGIKGLRKKSAIGDACAGLYDNRYIMLSFTSSDGSVNDTTMVYDTQEDIFISKDEGYYPKSYFILGGGADVGELYFGVSKNLGAIHQFGSGTDDESPLVSGIDVNIDTTFKTGDESSGEATRQSKIRQLKVSADTTPGARVKVTLETDNGVSTFQTIFSDDRDTGHTWGESGLKWGAPGLKWGGSSTIRKVFPWNLPMAVGSPHSYAVQIDLEDQDETFNIVEIAPAERPRARN